MFLWLPCLLTGVVVVRHGRWKSLAAAIAAFCVVALPWWATHAAGVVGYLGASTDADFALATNENMVETPWTDLENLSWYPAALVDAVGWPGAVALAVGALAWPRHGDAKGWSRWAIPLAAAAGGWLLLTMQVQRQDRYLIPLLPLLAALGGSSRARWLLGAVGSVGAYGAAAVYLSWSEVPASRAYEHDLNSAGASWPWVHESYQPTSMDPGPWLLDESLLKLRELHGSDEGTVGFLLDDGDGAPGFGLVLSRVAALGYRWHVATVMPMNRPNGSIEGAIFVGPFTTDDWPSRDFKALLAIFRPGDQLRERWIEHVGLTETDRFPLPGDKEGRLYVMEEGWVTLEL
jgi:hypothetical protein